MSTPPPPPADDSLVRMGLMTTIFDAEHRQWSAIIQQMDDLTQSLHHCTTLSDIETTVHEATQRWGAWRSHLPNDDLTYIFPTQVAHPCMAFMSLAFRFQHLPLIEATALHSLYMAQRIIVERNYSSMDLLIGNLTDFVGKDSKIPMTHHILPIYLRLHRLGHRLQVYDSPLSHHEIHHKRLSKLETLRRDVVLEEQWNQPWFSENASRRPPRF
jgi:hypothetical protein